MISWNGGSAAAWGGGWGVRERSSSRRRKHARTRICAAMRGEVSRLDPRDGVRFGVAQRLENAARPFWKSEASGFGEKYLHDGAGPLRPCRARRGDATSSVRGLARPKLIARIVASWAKGGARTCRGGGERSPAFPARRAGCEWRQPASARSGAHRATPRLRAFQRPRRRSRPRRGRGRASERVSKRHRHEIAAANRAGRATITLLGLVQCLGAKENFPLVFAVPGSRKPESTRSNLLKRSGKSRGFFIWACL